jgi:hypothetical protein
LIPGADVRAFVQSGGRNLAQNVFAIARFHAGDVRVLMFEPQPALNPEISRIENSASNGSVDVNGHIRNLDHGVTPVG